MDFYGEKSKEKTLSSRKHNQIVHFSNGRKATLLNIVKVWTDSMIHLVRDDGIEYILNQDNIDYTEVIWLE